MKKVMKFSLVMMALLAMAFTTFANTTDFSVRVNNSIGKTIRFSVTATSAIHISIIDAQNEVVFEEDANGAGTVNRQYDLKQLPFGTYLLKTESNAKISTYEVKVNALEAVISKSPVAETVKPMIVSRKDGRVSVSIINPEATPISIRLLDGNNNELFYEVSPQNVSLIKLFDFKTAEKGEYTFVTTYGNQTFVNRINAGR